ncbi:hypothetical protein HL653_07400 [Sphingomonas sp. AP4-R1]|uniref:hypothetical protein n=1 Tax=Sphingomonas sp. AP4-R1 TaxID=2735134 RepID=UPI001493A1C6|nr:hypothetical protein [Sphingomonas sp. AP4-R1]QJU57639.1 hypothetical protein HL653_07400 [Sphingomonas sp. AP4-R1]
MSTQSFSGDIRFQPFFLNFADLNMPGDSEKWRRTDRVIFCTVSAIACWMIFARLAGLVIGG